MVDPRRPRPAATFVECEMQLNISNHPLDQATALVTNEDGSLTGQTDAAYANMVDPFGGITAAAIMNALLMHPARLGDPVSLTINFAASIAYSAYRFDAEPVRTNRSTQHWSIKLSQGEELTTSVTAVFALRKVTWSTTKIVMRAVPARADVPRSGLGNTDRAWFDNNEMRFVRGYLLDLSEADDERDSVSVLWVRDESPRQFDFVSLTSICDSSAPRIMVRRLKRVPIGTVSMTIHFYADLAQLIAQSARFLLGSARASHFGCGYHDQMAMVWCDNSVLLATSHQIVYFKE